MENSQYMIGAIYKAPHTIYYMSVYPHTKGQVDKISYMHPQGNISYQIPRNSIKTACNGSLLKRENPLQAVWAMNVAAQSNL